MLRCLRNKNMWGFASIVEVVVTAVIFIIATFGIISTIAMLKPQGSTSSRRLEAAYIGKGIMDELRTEVNATPGSFFGPDLSVGAHPQITVGEYNVSYTVTSINPNLRQLNMTISWPDS